MTFTIALPDRYEYVVLTGVASVFLTVWQGVKVGRQRRKAGIKYPQLYAEKAEMAANSEAMTFNNLQRAHQNTLESYPQLLTCLFISGLNYPTFAASAGAMWIIGRVFYTLGYKAAPEKRFNRGGFLGNLSQLSLISAATLTAVGFVRERLGV